MNTGLSSANWVFQWSYLIVRIATKWRQKNKHRPESFVKLASGLLPLTRLYCTTWAGPEVGNICAHAPGTLILSPLLETATLYPKLNCMKLKSNFIAYLLGCNSVSVTCNRIYRPYSGQFLNISVARHTIVKYSSEMLLQCSHRFSRKGNKGENNLNIMYSRFSSPVFF